MLPQFCIRVKITPTTIIKPSMPITIGAQYLPDSSNPSMRTELTKPTVAITKRALKIQSRMRERHISLHPSAENQDIHHTTRRIPITIAKRLVFCAPVLCIRVE
jgi:hypothetical protein